MHSSAEYASPPLSSSSSSSAAAAAAAAPAAAAPAAPPAETVLPSGAVLAVLRAGDGRHFAPRGARVRLHYTARLSQDGALSAAFDDSRARGEPVVCRVGSGQLVAGLDDALPLMSKGELARVNVPPTRGFGARGFSPIVPPDSVLVYEVELLAVEL